MEQGEESHEPRSVRRAARARRDLCGGREKSLFPVHNPCVVINEATLSEIFGIKMRSRSYSVKCFLKHNSLIGTLPFPHPAFRQTSRQAHGDDQ